MINYTEIKTLNIEAKQARIKTINYVYVYYYMTKVGCYVPTCI